MARKKWSAEEKQKMVLAGLRNETSVAELCRQYGVSDVMYYKWKKAFLEGGLNRLKGNGKTSDHESVLKKENDVPANYYKLENMVGLTLNSK